MSDFLSFQMKQAERREAMANYNYAAEKLRGAQINERLAELKSQHEPLAGLITAKLSERDRLHAAAFYVVVGRLPDAVTIAENVEP